jgi:dihydrolipoamide dehydrogenase
VQRFPWKFSGQAPTIHPHPALSETEGESAGIFLGSATHLLSRKAK